MAGGCLSVFVALGSSLSLHGLFLAGYIGNSRTRFQSGTCISCTAQTFPQLCRSTFRTHPAPTEGGATITLHPSPGWLSPFTTEDQAEAEFPGLPRPPRLSSAPLRLPEALCWVCAKPPEANDPAALGCSGWRGSVCVYAHECVHVCEFRCACVSCAWKAEREEGGVSWFSEAMSCTQNWGPEPVT